MMVTFAKPVLRKHTLMLMHCCRRSLPMSGLITVLMTMLRGLITVRFRCSRHHQKRSRHICRSRVLASQGHCRKHIFSQYVTMLHSWHDAVMTLNLVTLLHSWHDTVVTLKMVQTIISIVRTTWTPIG